MKKTLIIIALFLFIGISQGQQIWEQKYSDKVAQTFTQTLSKNFILAGSEYESMFQRWYIFQTDSSGILEWDTTFLHGSNGMPECIKATTDTGYIVAGFNDINSYLLKYNQNNKLQWESEINTNYGELSIKDVLITNNKYLATGGGVSSIDQGLFITSLDSSGDTLWTVLYDEFASGISIVESFDSGYYCLSNRGTLLKIKSNGDTLWTIKTLDNFISNSMVKTKDSAIVISGNEFIGGDLIFLKVDKYGNQIWEKKYTSNYSYNNNKSISTTYDNGFITSNFMEPLLQNESNLWIMKLDEYGDSLFSIYSTVKLRPDKIIQTDDSLFVFLANDKYNNPRLIKTDSTGDVITSSKAVEMSNEQFEFFPNPFNNELTIRLTKTIKQVCEIEIYNSIGVLVQNQNVNELGQIIINTSNLDKGIYILNLKIGDNRITEKLIKK